MTNGERTEVDYFECLKAEPWVVAHSVKIRFKPGDPSSVVEHAARAGRESGYSETWVVCDVDDFDVRSAIRFAEELDVRFALSEPCFEVWLILHLRICRRGFNNATQVDAHLRTILPTWDKANLRFSDFRDGVMDAVGRAKEMGDPPDAHPSSTVWRLVESLKGIPGPDSAGGCG